MPLSAGAAAAAAAASASDSAAPSSHGLHFVSPVSGSSFSSSMPLLILLHIDFHAAALSSRWTLQVLLLLLLMLMMMLLLIFCDTCEPRSFSSTAAPYHPASRSMRTRQQLQDTSCHRPLNNARG
jgi:hypothetical protein